MFRRFCPPCLMVSALVFSACQTPPVSPTPAPVKPVVVRVPKMVVPAPLPVGVTVSAPQRGDTSVAFQQSRRGERTFPNNQIGANLAFTANLRMPRLEAVATGPNSYQLRMRFSNSTKEPIYVSLVCTYDGEKNAARVIRSLEFPVNTFRDIVMDLEGDPGRKLNIRASASSTPQP